MRRFTLPPRRRSARRRERDAGLGRVTHHAWLPQRMAREVVRQYQAYGPSEVVSKASVWLYGKLLAAQMSTDPISQSATDALPGRLHILIPSWAGFTLWAVETSTYMVVKAAMEYRKLRQTARRHEVDDARKRDASERHDGIERSPERQTPIESAKEATSETIRALKSAEAADLIIRPAISTWVLAVLPNAVGATIAGFLADVPYFGFVKNSEERLAWRKRHGLLLKPQLTKRIDAACESALAETSLIETATAEVATGDRSPTRELDDLADAARSLAEFLRDTNTAARKVTYDTHRRIRRPFDHRRSTASGQRVRHSLHEAVAYQSSVYLRWTTTGVLRDRGVLDSDASIDPNALRTDALRRYATGLKSRNAGARATALYGDLTAFVNATQYVLAHHDPDTMARFASIAERHPWLLDETLPLREAWTSYHPGEIAAPDAVAEPHPLPLSDGTKRNSDGGTLGIAR